MGRQRFQHKAILFNFSRTHFGLQAMRLCAVFACVFVPFVSQAHELDYTVIKTRLEIQGRFIRLTTQLPSSFDQPATQEDLGRMNAYYRERLVIANSGERCAIAIDGLVSGTQEQGARIVGTAICPESVARIESILVESSLFDNVYKHMDHFVSVVQGPHSRELTFSRIGSGSDEQLGMQGSDLGTHGVKSRGEQRGTNATVVRFIGLGLEHILLGYDHILFLLATILIVRSLKQMFILVTAFTIAHSITLILADLNVVSLTSRIVEPLIALSIAYVASRNMFLLKKQEGAFRMKERWVVTAGFGLIHGLGFAGALTEVAIPQQYFYPALIMFNLGVEAGQLMILALVVPLLKLAEHFQWRGRLKALMFFSGIIAVIAMIWFIQRVS